MNRDAVSETQYQDSKSHLSTYRKDNKSMLKRKVLTLLLALVLVVSLAVPALAASWGGIEYFLTISKGSSSSSVTMRLESVAAQVTAKGRVYVYALAPGDRMWGYWYSQVGDARATLYLNNYVYDENGTLYTGTIEQVQAQGYIGVNYVGSTSA